MKKEYLLKIDSTHGATVEIVAQTDSTKPIYVYYCGRDTGKRYVNIGAASRHLEKIAAMWGNETIKEYRSIDTIPVLGCSDWNKNLFRWEYGIIKNLPSYN